MEKTEPIAKLDKKDRGILYQLDMDARQANSQIAKKVHLSKEVVSYRIKRLISDGVILGFYAIIDISKLGYLNARIFMKFRNIGLKEEKEIIEFFENDDRFWWVNSMGPTLDLGVACWVKDIMDFHSLKQECMGKYRDKIEFFKDSIYSNVYIWKRKYLADDAKELSAIIIPGNSLQVEHDDYDLKILSTLSDDARLSIVELAEKVGLSITAVKYRLKKLKEKKVILGFRSNMPVSRIGYYWYKVEFQLEDFKSKKSLLAYFASHPNIVYAYESIGGGTDLEMEMEVKSQEQFREIIDGIREKFKDSIRNYIYYIWSAEHKIMFFPSHI